MRAIGWITGRPSTRPSQTSPGVRSRMAIGQSAPGGSRPSAPTACSRRPTSSTPAEAGEHTRLENDVTELDRASPGGTDEPTVLPLDASVTGGALGIVPDSKLRTHF